MKAIIVIEIDENHLLKETNELYDRLKGYKCDLRPLPEKLDFDNRPSGFSWDAMDGWNWCLEEILGETE